MKNNSSEERILDAAIRVIARSGLSGTSTRMIAEEAEMTPSNIHYYFKNKEDLFGRVQDKVDSKGLDYRQRSLNLHQPECMDEALDVFFLQKMDFIMRERNYDVVDIDFWAQARTSESLSQMVGDEYVALRQEVKEKVVDPFARDIPEYDKVMMTYVIVSMIQGASLQFHLKRFNIGGYFSYCKFIVRTMMNAYMPDQI